MLTVPTYVWDETIATFRTCGRGRDECVVYWIGPVAEPDRVELAVHPNHAATPYHYEVDSDWLTRFSFQLARDQRSARVQVHIHGGRACHSPTDDRWPLVSTPGFLSLVLPHFAMRDETLGQSYLVELDTDGRWVEMPALARLDGVP